VRGGAPHRLTADVVALARRYGRYGYRKVAELPRSTAGGLGGQRQAGRAIDSGAVDGAARG
jgi:hypothetical protein